jgi:hypothetical protein
MTSANATGTTGEPERVSLGWGGQEALVQDCYIGPLGGARSGGDGGPRAAPSDKTPPLSRVDPTAIEAWSAAVVSLLKALVIVVYVAFATWVLYTQSNALPFAPLLMWALRSRGVADDKAGR